MKALSRLFFAASAILLSMGLYAQDRGTVGLGARLCPDGGGFTARYYADRNVDFELQLNGSGGYYNSAKDGPSVAVVGLLEYNIIFDNPSMRLFIGPGIHGGTWNRYDNTINDYNRTSQGIFGIDAIFGFEYVFRSVPIGLSADIKPAMNFATDVAFFPNNLFGISARYYLSQKMMHKAKPKG